MADQERWLTLAVQGVSAAMLPVAVRAEERLSGLYMVAVELVSEDHTLTASQFVTKAGCLTIDQHNGQTARSLHGLVRSFSTNGPAYQGFWSYSLELVPALSFLDQTQDCRVFQSKTSVDIVKAVLEKDGIKQGGTPADLRVSVNGTPPTRVYTVQYNETDLAFVSRLLEEDGLSYFFEHASDKHTLVIADANTAFARIPDSDVRLVMAGDNPDVLRSARLRFATTPGLVASTDYNPEQPTTALLDQTTSSGSVASPAQNGVFSWPARAASKDEVTARTKHQMEAAEAGATLLEAAGENQRFVAGGKFTLKANPLAGGSDTDYVVLAITHSANDLTRVSQGAPPAYANSFTAFKASAPWRPQPLTPRPVIAGLQVAVVTGASGEEIYPDQYGRVKVQFYWDRQGRNDENSSCWVRVLQPWAAFGSGTWGWHHLPRVGSEVGVLFLDGDPDRPVVAGSFYNGVAAPVFALPDDKTKTGLRTRSTPGGGSSDFSEFSFDDKAGSELVFLHAQKDYTVEVEHDHSLDVGNNQTVTITQNRDVTLKSGNDTLTVKTGSLTHTVQKDYAMESKMGGVSVVSDMKDIALKASLGNVTIEAMQGITLKVGANSVKIDQSGITLNGMIVKVQGQIMAQLKATMMQVNGDAMTLVKGGIMMLN